MNELGNGPWDKNYKPSGISKAEEAAFKAYPPKRKEVSMTGAIYTVVGGDFERRIFQEGYEAAEKDLAPLIEAATVVYEAWNGGTMDDVRRGMVELGKQIKEKRNDRI